MLKRIALLSILAFSSAGLCFADAGTRKLEDMIQRSKYIVLARVSRVKLVDNVKLAELDVTCFLKGESNVTHLYYWASPTWACDVSDAQVGEEALFFLWYPELAPASKEHLRFLKRARPFTQGATIYLLEHSGRGRFKPRLIDGESFLYVHKYSDVIFPTSIQIVGHPDPKDPNLGLMRWKDVLSFISVQAADRSHNNSFEPERSKARMEEEKDFPFILPTSSLRIIPLDGVLLSLL